MFDGIKKTFTLLFQLILVALTVLLAGFVTPKLVLIQGFILGSNEGFTAIEFRTMLAVFLAFHFLLSLISLYFNRDLLFSNLKRTLNEIYFMIIANTLSAFFLFTFTVVAFNANFFLYTYILCPLFYFCGFLIVSWACRTNRDSHTEWMRTIPFASGFKDFLLGRGAIFTGIVLLLPISLALYYKKSTDFRNVINTIRVSFNFKFEGKWELRDAYAGQVFDQPIDLRFLPNDDKQFFYLGRAGMLYRVSTAPVWHQDLLLDIRENVGGTEIENGALSFALHPEFGHDNSPNQGLVYVFYTHVRPGSQSNRLSCFNLSLPDLLQRVQSETILIDQYRQPSGFHNGGTVLFGPDGFLYLSIGDFMEHTGQKIDTSLASGIIRIDADRRGGDISTAIKKQPYNGKTADYYIPTDNPFYGQQGVLEEFWALGLRNPFRMSVDRQTGEVWVGDVGGEKFEEVNRVRKGSNGQWPYGEGPELSVNEKPAVIWGNELPPFYYYRQTALDRAIIGGIVYRGNKHPQLYGQYIFADNLSGLVRSLAIGEAPTPRILAQTNMLGPQGITSLTETPSGEIYVTVLGSGQRVTGRILQLTPVDAKSQSSIAAPPPKVPSEGLGQAVSDKYDMLCSRCHGLDGKGGEATPMIARRPDFTHHDWQQSVSNGRIKETVTKGGAAMGLSRDMPAWEGVFTEAELELLVGKIRSFDTSGR